MELSLSYILSIFLFLYLFHQQSHCQQAYINDTQFDCINNPSLPKGYLCSGPLKSCKSFVTFRSQPPYNTSISIAYFLGSEASTIASINNISNVDIEIPTDKLIIVPVSCSCSGNFYQYYTSYTVRANDSYFQIANKNYQGLTTCQAVVGQNYYGSEDVPVGANLSIPLRCACPSENQTENGVTSLLAYMVTSGDSVASIGKIFGVSEQSIIEANMLSENSVIYALTPLLIPLKGESCSTNPDNFFCFCPNGYLADGSLENFKCIPDGKKFPVNLVIILGVAISMGLLCAFFFVYQLYRFIKKRRHRIRKEKLFRQNGGLLLQQRLSSYGITEKAKIFAAEELQRATDNYNPSRFLGQGGYGTVYKGMLPNGSIVAVKRSKAIDQGQIKQFINEVVILSQINHRNIVKLLGCCLETEVPLLVYEFISNGTLSNHIHQQNQQFSLSWEDRVRIACEVAGAVAYMHSAASIPVFHRDIKSSNILLDDKYSAKVADFGTSRTIPYDKTHLTTAVQGTFGYLDPEYFQTSQFTEKSDVYSFGVVLVELLTGQKPISFARAEEQINLVAHFISLMKENHLLHIIDPLIAREARREEIHAVAKLAMRCLRLNGKSRPTMKEVAIELEGLRKSQRCLEINQEPEILRDQAWVVHTTDGTEPESIEDSIINSLEMESTSI